MKRLAWLPVALAMTVAAGCGEQNRENTSAVNGSDPAATAVGTSGDRDTRVPDGDVDFVRDVAIANTAEIELGKLALERAANANVKKFAQMMIDDHTKAAGTLSAVAGRYGIAVPAELDDKHRSLREKLAGLKGTEFDREYMDAMVDGHDDVLDKLESRTDKAELENWKSRKLSAATGKKEKVEVEALAVVPEKSDNAVTASINQWAADTYPVVFAHAEAAKDAKAGVSKRATH